MYDKISILITVLKNAIQDAAAGGSFDWTYAVADIKYSIALELRPGQGEQDYNFGFALPEDSNFFFIKIEIKPNNLRSTSRWPRNLCWSFGND